MPRRDAPPASSARIAWYIDGTAVVQVGRKASSQARKRPSRYPGVQAMLPPLASVASSAATSPWMWNSGMMLRQRSAGGEAERRRDVARRGAEIAVRQRDDLGPRGRARGVQHAARRRPDCGSESPLRAPIGCLPSDRVLAGGARRAADEVEAADTDFAGDCARRPLVLRRQQQCLGVEVGQVEPELVGPVRGIERRADGTAHHGHRGARHFGTVGQDHGDPVPRADASAAQAGDGRVDLPLQRRAGERRAVRCEHAMAVGPLRRGLLQEVG